MPANNVYNEQWDALDSRVVHLNEPADGGVAVIDYNAYNILVIESAITCTLEAASAIPVGVKVLVIAQAACTVEGITFADGDYAEFVLVLNSSAANVWVAVNTSTVSLATSFLDDAEITFGTGLDAQIGWETGDASNHALVIAAGDSNGAIHFTDKAAIGTDWNLSADTHVTGYFHSNTTPATDYVSIGGHDGTTATINVAGGTTLALAIAGTPAANVIATGVQFPDSAGVILGTGSDISIIWDGTDLDITQATANSSVKWGVDGAGIDQVWYGDTASNSMTWDQSADDLIFTAAAGIVGAGSNEVPFTVPAAQETIAAGAGGAISVATHFTSIAADAGGDTATMAAGTQKGQIKEILMPTTAGGTVVVTIATGSGGNTLTLSVAGDFARFYWTGAAWVPIALYNQATGSVATPTWTTV